VQFCDGVALTNTASFLNVKAFSVTGVYKNRIEKYAVAERVALRR